MWTEADNNQQVDLLKADRTLWQHMLEDASTDEIRILALLDRARAAKDEARKRVREDTAEIDRLEAEISKQRHGG